MHYEGKENHLGSRPSLVSKHDFSLNEVTDYGMHVKLPIATSSIRESETVNDDENRVYEVEDDMVLQPSGENLRIEASSIQIFSQSQQRIDVDQSDSLVEIGAQSSARISLDGNTEIVERYDNNFELVEDFLKMQISK